MGSCSHPTRGDHVLLVLSVPPLQNSAQTRIVEGKKQTDWSDYKQFILSNGNTCSGMNSTKRKHDNLGLNGLTSQTRSSAWKSSSSDMHSFGKNSMLNAEDCAPRPPQAQSAGSGMCGANAVRVSSTMFGFSRCLNCLTEISVSWHSHSILRGAAMYWSIHGEGKAGRNRGGVHACAKTKTE